MSFKMSICTKTLGAFVTLECLTLIMSKQMIVQIIFAIESFLANFALKENPLVSFLMSS
jgi:hypothetical protein